MSARERLTQATYDSLDAMMTAYAEEAVRVAGSEHGRKLDYSDASISILEELLDSLPVLEGSDSRENEDWMTMLWGSYFGEVFKRRFSAEWTMTEYPGGQVAVPTIEVRGSRLYPLNKVHRRLSMGAAESLPAFFQLVIERLNKTNLPN